MAARTGNWHVSVATPSAVVSHTTESRKHAQNMLGGDASASASLERIHETIDPSPVSPPMSPPLAVVAARRILVVAPQPFYQDRGTPIALRQVLRAASELGYDVDVLTFPVGHDIELPRLRLLRTGNPLGIRSVPIGFSMRKLALDASLVRALASRLRKERYSCIHALEEAAFPALLLARRHGVPLLYDMQSSLPEQLAQLPVFRLAPVHWVLRLMERWLLGEADLVVSSIGLAEQVRRVAPATTVREWCFPGSIRDPDPEEVRSLRGRLGLSPEQPLVLYSGTFADYQGLDRLVGAVPVVRAEFPRAVFVLVGAERGVEVAAEGQLAPLVESGALLIVDRQPREAMAAYHAAADVLVSPRSYGGNLPLKVFDYLAAGRPIVATDIPSHRAVLAPDRAVLVAPKTEAVAEGILGLLRDPGTADRLAVAARSYAEKHLAWTAFVRCVGEFYDEVHRDGGGG